MLSHALEHNLRDYANTYTWERLLQPGEILVFNNQRLLHGRRAFEVADPVSDIACGRHLVGCYTNIDETLNEYRMLRQRRYTHGRETSFIRNVGNGSNGSS
jgi:alpha-ketoglutarate-dependent taurine dioxygenase